MRLALTGCTFSFSGGKDSTVLLHIAREMYGDAIKAVFIDTGLEYPQIRKFIKTFDNVDIVKPKMGFKKVVEKYGFPLISKEVSESVFGARKYLTSILAENSLGQTDRQTDRQTASLSLFLQQADRARLLQEADKVNLSKYGSRGGVR